MAEEISRKLLRLVGNQIKSKAALAFAGRLDKLESYLFFFPPFTFRVDAAGAYGSFPGALEESEFAVQVEPQRCSLFALFLPMI